MGRCATEENKSCSNFVSVKALLQRSTPHRTANFFEYSKRQFSMQFYHSSINNYRNKPVQAPTPVTALASLNLAIFFKDEAQRASGIPNAIFTNFLRLILTQPYQIEDSERILTGYYDRPWCSLFVVVVVTLFCPPMISLNG